MSNYKVFDTKEKTIVFTGSSQECMKYVMELCKVSEEHTRYDIGKTADKHPMDES